MIVSTKILANRLSQSFKSGNRTDSLAAREDSSSIEASYSTSKRSILACSVATDQDASTYSRVLQGRELLADKKRPFEHLLPQPFLKSAVRVTAIKASTILANYVTDQLTEETKREELVQKGELTPEQADEQNAEWEKREWGKRWEDFPTKVFNGVLLYQAIIMTMRYFEHVASNMFDVKMLDKLTKDPFKAAIRASKDTDDSASLRREMMQTCFWSNVIAYLADYSVHQVILTYGYYVYMRAKRRQRLELGNGKDSGEDAEEYADDETVAFSFLFKSSKLAVSRILGLGAAAVGGAVGSVLYPGWGTVIGTQFGDGMVAAALDDVHAHSLPGQKW